MAELDAPDRTFGKTRHAGYAPQAQKQTLSVAVFDGCSLGRLCIPTSVRWTRTLPFDKRQPSCRYLTSIALKSFTFVPVGPGENKSPMLAKAL